MRLKYGDRQFEKYFRTALPVELLTIIFSLAVEGPDDHNTILALLGVCAQWRSIMDDTPRFFVMANWDKWDPFLLKLWCERAEDEELTIQLSQRGAERVLDFEDDAFFDALQGTKDNWGVLDLHIESMDQLLFHALGERLLRETLPTLHTLKLKALSIGPQNSRPGIMASAGYLPSIKNVLLHGVTLRYQSWYSKSLTLHLSSGWSLSEWTNMWSGSLSSLTLVGLSVTHMSYGFPSEFPSLRDLHFVEADRKGVAKLLAYLSLPGLSSITFRDTHQLPMPFTPWGLRSLHKHLSRAAPCLEELKITEKDTSKLLWATRVLGQLSALDEYGAVPLPDLKRITLYPETSIPIDDREQQAVQEDLRAFLSFESRRLECLRIHPVLITPAFEPELKGLVEKLEINLAKEEDSSAGVN